jgi:hypothetical protein
MGASKTNPNSILKKQGLLPPKEKPKRVRLTDYDMLDIILRSQFKKRSGK